MLVCSVLSVRVLHCQVPSGRPLSSCCGVGRPTSTLAMGHSVEGGLCIGKSCRTELFEGVVGVGCVEGVDLARLVCGNWQVKPQGVEGGGTCIVEY